MYIFLIIAQELNSNNAQPSSSYRSKNYVNAKSQAPL